MRTESLASISLDFLGFAVMYSRQEVRTGYATMNGSKAKDTWDKLDVIGKFLASVVLVGIAMFIKCGSDKISDSLATGNLVKSLIADLTEPESTRQDLALIALHRSIPIPNQGADRVTLERHQMVLEIAERIYGDLDPGNNDAGKVAFRIIEERDPDRAAELRRRATEPADVAGADAEAPRVPLRLVTRTLDARVFLHIRTEEARDFAEGLRRYLEAQGFSAPGVERVTIDFSSNVRYFHEDDRSLAEETKRTVEGYLENKGRPLELKITHIPQYESRVSRGHVEVWLRLDR